MVYTNRRLNGLGCVSRVLGQVSLWMGVVLALAWAVLFSVIARHITAYQAGSGLALRLPVEPPLVGLVLALLGLVFAQVGRQPITGAALAGLILNTLALGLAVAVLAGCLG